MLHIIGTILLVIAIIFAAFVALAFIAFVLLCAWLGFSFLMAIISFLTD